MSTPKRKGRRVRWHACNVVDLTGAPAHLWQFNAASGAPLLDQAVPEKAPLPARAITKDWQHLLRPRLNVAWLPPEEVFLRLAELPPCEPEERLAMVELQLEKLSPLPVNQIVWTIEPLATTGHDLQTVAVLIAPRHVVEQHLGRLEGRGYLADRLDVPWLHQLAETTPTADSAWVFLHPQSAAMFCVVGWWIDGRWRSLSVLSLPHGADGATALTEHLTQAVWAAEMEGWLHASPEWHLVADAAITAGWEAPMRAWAGGPIQVHNAPPPRELAATNARRAARGDSAANLLPAEYATRYRQQYVDSLWMRGLGGVLAVYLMGLMVYFGALRFLEFKRDQLQAEVRALAGSYTNALELKARIQVVREQIDLKQAALDCWLAAVENLPADLTLTALNFQRGQKLILFGTAPSGQASKITDYFEALTRASVHGTNGPPLFSKVDPPRSQGGSGGQPIRWDLACTLNRSTPE